MNADQDVTLTRWQLFRDRLVARLPQRWRSGQRRTALAGVSWSLAGQGGTQVLRLASTLVLARLLLSPDAFGLVALVNVFITGLEMLSDVGLGTNIVQHARGEEPSFLGTAYAIQVGRGVVLWLLAACLAFPFAWFYQQPTLGPLIIVAALATLIRGTANVGIHVLTRRVLLRPVTLLMLGSEFVGFSVAVTWALSVPSVWALVAGTVASAGFYSAASHLVLHQHHRLMWDRSAAHDILKFGGWVFVATATWFLCSQGERLFLGKLITPEQLGCFVIALSFCTLPTRVINDITARVYLPLVATRMREDRASAGRLYGRSRLVFAGLAVLATTALWLAGMPLVRIILPQSFAAVGDLVQLLALRAGLELLSAPIVSLTLGAGNPQFSAVLNIVRLGLMLAVVFSGALVTFPVLILLLVAVPFACYPVLIYAVARALPSATRTEILLYVGFTAFAALLASISLSNG